MQYPVQSKILLLKRNQPVYWRTVTVNVVLVLILLINANVICAQTTQTFTSPNSFTAAAGVTSLSVECWGGGGGGGNVSHTGGGTSRGGGGAGGAYAKKTIPFPSGAYTVTVGTGGTGGNAGSDSWFGCTCTAIAKGGAAGGNGSKSNGAGANGTISGSIGDAGFVFAGGHGATGTVLGTGAGGGGAGSSGGGGNSALTIINGSGTASNGGDGAPGFLLGLGVADGQDGSNYGGGGCGATCITLFSGSSATGGKGGDGLVTVSYTCPTYNLTNTANTPTCAGNAATITLTSAAANLPAGTYSVTYNLSSPNAVTGNTATMTVSTAGTGTFTTSVLSSSGATAVTITNLKSGSGAGCSNTTSINNSATITVNTAPSITGQPSTPSATCSGSGVQTISVSATGSGLAYSWRKNGTPVSNGGVYSGQGTATLTLTNATASEAGTYNVVVSGSCSPSVTSNTVTVTVNAVTSIFSDVTPVSQLKLLHSTPANISITAGGTSTGYQWYVNTLNSNSGGTSVGAANGGQTNTYTPSTATESTLYYYCVVSGTCGTQVSSAATVVATNTATWLGGGSPDWSTNSNWNTGTAPSGTNNAIIPTGHTPYPALSVPCAVNNLNIQSAVSIIIGSNTFTINGAISGTGTLTGSAASGLVINGAAGTVYFTYPDNYLKYFTINLGASATLGNELNISAGSSTGDEGVLSVNGTGVLTTDDLLTIKSNQYSTARIAQGSSAGGYISGDVTIERYIPQNSTKAWRMLAANTSGQTIKEAWQEDQSPMVNGNPGYGIMITKKFTTMAEANALGFDTISPSPSIYSYSTAVNTWVALTNTNSKLFASEEGYFVFIRGDRREGQFTAFTAPAGPTILRSKGAVFQGDQPVKNAAANKNTLLRNPFASAIDLRNVSIGGGLVNAFLVWDPKLTGTSGNGAYQTLTKVGADYLVTPGGGSYSSSGSVCNTIESGAAFIVQATGTDGTVQVPESCKTNGSNPVFRPVSAPFNGKRIIANLYADNSSHSLVDGNMILFDEGNYNGVDKGDVRKLSNIGETFGISKTGSELVVERRIVPAIADTVLFNMRNLKKINYQIELIADNMEIPGMYGYIEDKYTNTGTLFNAAGSTLFNFSVNTDSASFAANRFRLVFKPTSVLPVVFTGIKAVQKNNDVKVEWKVENEISIARYDIERSVDGTVFKRVGAVEQNNATAYSWVDHDIENGTFYYRVRSAGNDGYFQYSKNVKISAGQTYTKMNVSPNPVRNSSINIRLAGQKAGKVGLVLLNSFGQQIYKNGISHGGGNFNQQIKIPSGLSAGVYELQMMLQDGTIKSQKLVVAAIE